MSTLSSPARFSGDYDGFYDANFTADISNRMRVPHRIRIAGNGDEGGDAARYLDHEKLEMYVPGRILVAGQDQHIGLKSPPRELHLEQSMIRPPSIVRVQTPPRVLTLEDHSFPTVEDETELQEFTMASHELATNENQSSRHTSTLGNDQSMTLSYPSSPPLQLTSETAVSPTEELLLLRRHVAKLGRRVLVLENDSHQRQQREMIIYTFGVAYFVLKTLMWFHRHW